MSDEDTVATLDVDAELRPTSRDHDFVETYRRIHPQLFAIASRHGSNRQDVEDLLQTAVYRSLVRYKAGAKIDNLEAYITTALLSACMDEHRWKKRQRSALGELAKACEMWAGSPHDEYADKLSRTSVGVAYTKLSSECQELLRLRVLQGIPVKRCAEQLIIAEGTVKSRCSRCLEHLGRLLESS